MLELLRVFFLASKRESAISNMQSGWRVKLWKWERGQCNCQESVVYLNMPGTRG